MTTGPRKWFSGALHARGGGPSLRHPVVNPLSCSPRTWRWSVSSRALRRTGHVLSTHVEVVRGAPARTATPAPCSPRTWRWSELAERSSDHLTVLSTHVEVVRWLPVDSRMRSRALHARGGGPSPWAFYQWECRCSPRTWRWSGHADRRDSVGCVLSTHVEVVRLMAAYAYYWERALHARGGGPPTVTSAPWAGSCSPRTWRWSECEPDGAEQRQVLSTHVEVVRRCVNATASPLRALHARGGGPGGYQEDGLPVACSPRTWR